MNLDHDTFHALEIDALYDELDGPRAAEIHAHAASCEACSSRFERLRRARMRGLAALAEPVSDDFESRVMAAVDAALARRAGGPVLVPLPQHLHGAPSAANPGAANTNAGAAGPGAKVIPFFSRPSFAVAATLVLVIGAAAILGQLSMAKKSAPMASAPAPGEAASGFTPVPVSDEPLGAVAQQTALATAAAPVVAANEAPADDGNSLLTERARSGAPAPKPARKPAAVAMNEPPPPPAAAAPSPAKSKAAIGDANDGSLAAAKALYGAGRYSEACPKFEALRASSPEADLYAARCVLRANGCSAGVPRLDDVASRYAGTEVATRARADSDACTRLQASKRAAPNAGPAATTGPGTPGGGGAAGRPSAPKAPAQEFDSK